MSRYDVVVFGASGYTGQFVAEELARSVTTSGALTWAIAGRNRKKLDAVLVEASKHVGRDVTSEAGIIIADVNDKASLENMCEVAKVVISCVGPYRFWGGPVIEACISQKCHYVDICGETQVLETFQEKYHADAEKAGVHIVQACGFDCIPADLGMLYTIEKFPGVITEAESVHKIVSRKGGSVHTGTWASLLHSIANANEMRKKRTSLAPFQWLGPKLKKRGHLFKSDMSRGWSMPFMGADVAVVRRSQRARQESGQHPVQYGCYIDFGHLFFCLMLMVWGMIVFLITRFKAGTKFAVNHPRLLSFGVFNEDGSTREQLEASTFSTTFHARGFTDKASVSSTKTPNVKFVTRVSGPDPGYMACSIMAVQSGLCLLRGDLPNQGGVLTPAVAFNGTNLISELDKAGVKFSIVQKS